MFLRVEDLDDKDRRYTVVSMTPRENTSPEKASLKWCRVISSDPHAAANSKESLCVSADEHQPSCHHRDGLDQFVPDVAFCHVSTRPSGKSHLNDTGSDMLA
jgi:hypothetical protein